MKKKTKKTLNKQVSGVFLTASKQQNLFGHKIQTKNPGYHIHVHNNLI